MKKVIIFFGLLSCLLPLQAQIDEMRKAFEQYQQRVKGEFEDYRNQANQQFADFIKQKWEEFHGEEAVPMPKDDKVPPVIKEKPSPKPLEDTVIHHKEVPVPKPQPKPEPIAPIKETPPPVRPETFTATLYGTQFAVRLASSQKFALKSLSTNEIAERWTQLSSNEYNNLIVDCLALRDKHQLSDWAYLQLLDQLCSGFLGKGSNEAELLKAFVFAQSGYQMRLAIANGHLYMLYGCDHRIYKQSYWTIDNQRFYCTAPINGNISVCGASMPDAQPLSLRVTRQPQLAARPSTKTHACQRFSASVQEDANLMAYLGDYPTSQLGSNPMTRWALYAEMPLSEQAQKTLYPTLRKQIAGLSRAEAVNVLCHWVQTAFVYEYDDKVWGHDRAFFADESLYYPYCDCEDRSILLTRLVRDLLGLRCALVYSTGHLYTAIAVGNNTPGAYFTIDGERFLVCDPTYINAPIGDIMPGMDKDIQLIVLN